MGDRSVTADRRAGGTVNVRGRRELRPVVARSALFPRPPDATGRKTPMPATRGVAGIVQNRRSEAQMGRTVSACGPFAPWLASNETRWFSSRVRNPLD